MSVSVIGIGERGEGLEPAGSFIGQPTEDTDPLAEHDLVSFDGGTIAFDSLRLVIPAREATPPVQGIVSLELSRTVFGQSLHESVFGPSPLG